jgi:hypothetical protein
MVRSVEADDTVCPTSLDLRLALQLFTASVAVRA